MKHFEISAHIRIDIKSEFTVYSETKLSASHLIENAIRDSSDFLKEAMIIVMVNKAEEKTVQ